MLIFRYSDFRFVFNEKFIQKASKQLFDKRKYQYNVLIGVLDMLILARADLVIGTHSSNFGRLVFELMHIDDSDPFYKFISLDNDYYLHGFPNGIHSKFNFF